MSLELWWESWTDSYRRIDALPEGTSSRKLRLFACACCTRVSHLLVDARSRRAVEWAEAVADGSVVGDHNPVSLPAAIAFVELGAVADIVSPDLQSALGWFSDPRDAERTHEAYQAAYQAAATRPPPDANRASAVALAAFAAHSALALAPATAAEFAAGHSALAVATANGVLDNAGDPFRPITIETSLLSDSVVKIARAIDEERSFDKMPVLADALEECGVSDGELLAHCRADTPHTRGCHILDLVLGKD